MLKFLYVLAIATSMVAQLHYEESIKEECYGSDGLGDGCPNTSQVAMTFAFINIAVMAIFKLVIWIRDERVSGFILRRNNPG